MLIRTLSPDAVIDFTINALNALPESAPWDATLVKVPLNEIAKKFRPVKGMNILRFVLTGRKVSSGSW